MKIETENLRTSRQVGLVILAPGVVRVEIRGDGDV